MKPLFAADPLLLYDLIYICPENERHRLFAKAPAHLSLAYLSFKRAPMFLMNVRFCIHNYGKSNLIFLL